MSISATRFAPRAPSAQPPTPTGVRQRRLGLRFAVIAGLLFSYVALLGVAMDVLPYREWAPLWIVPLLGVLSVPLLRRVCRHETDPFVRRLIWIAWSVKLLAAIVNYGVQHIIYRNVADANDFDRYGSLLAAGWRKGQFSLAPLSGVGGGVGNHTLQFLTGVFYTVFGSSELTLFFVFSWLGFWGMYFFYRAAVISLPTIDRRRYAMFVFFWPSLIFWSSALGKDAWTFLFLGLASYGLARGLQRMRGGWPLLIVAVLAITVVRADITLLFVVGAVVSYGVARVWRRHEDPRRERFRYRDVASLLVLALAVVATLLAFKLFFHLANLSPTSFERVLKQASSDSAEGKSTYSGSISPVNILIVLFRPLPFQVTSATSAIVSLEGLFLIGLLVTGWRRIVAGLRLAKHNGYAAFCVVYAALFIIAFSSLSNAGTLDRERIQLLPIMFVLLSFAKAPSRYARTLPRRMVRPEQEHSRTSPIVPSLGAPESGA